MEGCFAGVGCLLGGCSLASVVLHRPAPKVKASAIEAAGHKFVELPDGRKLEYTVGGDLDGHPVYYQHGYGGSCMLPASWKNAAKRCGLKLIAASMPGFGLSDSYPMDKERSLSEWPADVLAVLQEEGVGKAHLLGMSAGCVHVAALAQGLPCEMVGNVCLATPTCPSDVPGATDGISPVTLAVKKLFGTPYIGDVLAYMLAKMSSRKRMGVCPDAKAALERMRVEMPDVFEDVIAMSDHAVSATYRGFVDNMGTITKPLPFELEDVGALVTAGRSIAITSSDDDTTNPLAMQLWFHGQLPGSTFMKYGDGWGHLHVFPPAHFERALRFLATGRDPGQTGVAPPPTLLGASVEGKAVANPDKA